MRLASYMDQNAACYGIVEGEGIIDLSRRIGARYPDIRTLLAHEGLAAAQKAGAGAGSGPEARRREAAARREPVWMKPGDVVEVEVSGVGILRNTIKDD